jgi:hypothetical protein
VVRLYGLRNWIEHGYKQVKDELGWADFMVRSDQAIRRHWTLVCCAFSFCWRTWLHAPPTPTQATSSAHAGAVVGRGKISASAARLLCWPVALRAVRGWLAPWTFIHRWWQAWAGSVPPPSELQTLLDAAGTGQPLYLYLPRAAPVPPSTN